MRVTGIALLLLLAACDHTDPFPTGPRTGDGSFDLAPPIRLTFSTGDDNWPTASRDGRWFSYRFSRGTTDNDYCAGILPTIGGQRYASLCAWDVDDNGRSDEFRSAVMLDDITVAYVRSLSGRGKQSPDSAGVYVASIDDPRDARKVLTLLHRPTGGNGFYRYLLGPVAENDHQFLALATDAYIGPTFAFGPVDTTYVGIEIARFDVSTTPATITSLALVPGAIGWALDQSSNLLYYHVPTYSAPPGSGGFSVIADTIYRVPIGGGTPEVAYGRAPVAGTFDQRLDGFAVANGRLFVAVHSQRTLPNPPGGIETRSDVGEVQVDGSLRVIDTRLTTNGSRWGRLSFTPDGGHLVAESLLGGQRDLYLLEPGT